MTKRQQWEMFMSYVQTVLLLQLHKLEVSPFWRLCQWCADPTYPIRPQCVLIARRRPLCWSCTPVLVVYVWSCSPLGSSTTVYWPQVWCDRRMKFSVTALRSFTVSPARWISLREQWHSSYVIFKVYFQSKFKRLISKNIAVLWENS